MPVLGGTTLPDGVVTLPKLGFDVATQVELDAVEAALEGDVDAVTAGLAGKADTSALAGKANTTDVTTALALKADATAVTAGLAGKLDATGTALNAAKVAGITVTGTPTSGNVLTATSTTAAGWSPPASGAGDATTTGKGIIQLAGDLAGTAGSPTVPGLAAKADSTAVTSALAGKVPTGRQVTAGTGLTGGGDLSVDRTFTVAYGTSATTATRGDDTRVVGALQAGSNLADLANAVTARSNLGLGTAAVRGVGTSSGTVAAGDDSRIVGAAQRSGATVTGAWDFTGATVTGITGAGYTQVVDARSTGVVGDGTTNDTTALQAALTAAGPGGAVYIPAGLTCKVTSALTLASRAITGRGTILATSLATVINASGTSPAIDGIRLIARACTNGVYVGAGTTGLTITNATLGGDSTNQPGQAVYLNETGIVGTRIDGCTFTHAIYGVLTDSGATDLRDLRITDCRFEECGGGSSTGGDAIELNHPGTAFVGAAQVIIDGNYISCANGGLDTGGFGVGVAGATRVIIVNNTFDGCRVQAIHVEDEAAHVTCTGNTITGGGVGIYVLGGDHILITGNQIYATGGAGIQFAQTTSPFNSWGMYWRVAANILSGCGAHGIDINIDYDVNGAIEQNLVTGCTGDGLWVHSTGTAVATGPLAIRGNQFSGNTGWGMTLDSHLLQTVADNTTTANGAGTFRRTATANGILIPVHNPSAQKLDATFTTNTTGWVTMWPAGSRATGNLVVSAARFDNSADRCQQVWDIVWDGATALTATPIGDEVSNGGMTGSEVRVNAGNLQVRVGHASVTDGSVVRVWAQMQGAVLL